MKLFSKEAILLSRFLQYYTSSLINMKFTIYGHKHCTPIFNDMNIRFYPINLRWIISWTGNWLFSNCSNWSGYDQQIWKRAANTWVVSARNTHKIYYQNESWKVGVICGDWVLYGYRIFPLLFYQRLEPVERFYLENTLLKYFFKLYAPKALICNQYSFIWTRGFENGCS